jgi:hypothetical protein
MMKKGAIVEKQRNFRNKLLGYIQSKHQELSLQTTGASKIIFSLNDDSNKSIAFMTYFSYFYMP